MQNARAHLYITGRVQGVFYRAFTRDVAQRCGLCGWVRNLPDGSVEAVLEGLRSDIEMTIRNCHEGPPGAHVDKINVDWEGYQGNLKGFEIRYY